MANTRSLSATRGRRNRCKRGTQMCKYIRKCVSKSNRKTKRCRNGNRKCPNKRCYTH